MAQRNIIILICIALVTGGLIYVQSVNINLVGLNQGFAPEQPLAFSHRLHSGDLQIQCLYCHTGAEKSSRAGIPSANTCMNCHRFVTAKWDLIKYEEQQAEAEKRDLQMVVSPELQKLYTAIRFSTDNMAYQDTTGRPLEWIRVHDLPDFVSFDHSRHVTANVDCQTCHGPVETMETVRQEQDLSMGWCLTCHRDVNMGVIADLKGKHASTDCVVCHY
ncbi:MAG: cytochrome c3 family protein [Candidatus Latescibacteria bacterium]|jgi:hypothetical protein|nr:cytochrome c3 family protein [Candidatus Latescibacterota bacterium]